MARDHTRATVQRVLLRPSDHSIASACAAFASALHRPGGPSARSDAPRKARAASRRSKRHMLGTKSRAFAPLVNVSLDDLVPADQFYRHVERTLNLTFVRELVHPCYAAGGRPSIDPVVFFKLQLIMFFEGIRSERQLMEVAADRLSLRWFLGYDLHEKLPDHSSLTRIRDRYGVGIFRRFFDRIVEQCHQEGLVWGKELYLDSTQVEANADKDAMRPRFYLNAMNEHLA